MNTDFKEKRIDYLNNWPNVEPFDIEKKYYDLVKKIKDKRGTIFVPFQLKKNDDPTYNKTISFMIEAIDQVEKYPNFSYEFIFKAYNCFMDLFYPSIVQITSKNKMFCDNEWKNILDSHLVLMKAFKKLIAVIPVKACQYLYIRLTDRTGDNKAYQRVTTDKDGGSSVDSTKRKNFVDAIEAKYGLDTKKYAETIRNASLLYRKILKEDTIDLDISYHITTEDRLYILVSGFLYTLRNDIMHGSSISITKSSKTTLGTYAIDFFAYMLLYYLLVILIVNNFSTDYSKNVYDDLAKNIETNVDLYKQIFGKEIER